jgi:enoyl-[acyl-carrier protein] reductase II
MLAAMVLGAAGVQIGTRFIATPEASSHDNFKNVVVDSKEGDTMLSMKKVVPVRLVKNKFYQQVLSAENNGASEEELRKILGRARAKLGMFEGDLDEGELEIGQVGALVNTIQPAAKIVQEIWNEFNAAWKKPIITS